MSILENGRWKDVRLLSHFSKIITDGCKAINVHSEVNPRTMAREDRHTDAVLLLTELAMRCCTLSMDNLSGITPTTLLSISPWTC